MVNSNIVVKYLVVRFSSIGDIVLTTPVIRCLKNQVNGARIHYVTKEQFVPILSNNPYIDHVHSFSGNLNALIRELKNEHFDYIIDLHHNLRSALLKSRIRIISFSFPKLNVQKWLLVNLKINRLPDIHIVDRYFKTVRLFDVTNDQQGLDYFIPERESVSRESLPVEFWKGYIAFAIGGLHATKKLTAEKIIGICKGVDKPVVLLGSKEDAETGREVTEKAGNTVYNACGNFSINQSAFLVQQADLVITHDTGLMHIAAAFRKKIISIWGNTIPEFGMYPYHPDPASIIVQVPKLSCRPCSKIGFEKCPKKHFRCINDIDINRIVQIVNERLTEKP
jgi:ADP-heptose:LPS heptosyltransferase